MPPSLMPDGFLRFLIAAVFIVGVAVALACGEPIRNRVWWERCGAFCPYGVPQYAEPMAFDAYGYPKVRGVCICGGNSTNGGNGGNIWPPDENDTLDTCRARCGHHFKAYFVVAESCVCAETGYAPTCPPPPRPGP